MKNWLQQLSMRERTIAIIGLVVGVCVSWFLIAPPRWTGFAGKTLWDWLQLLILPTIILCAALIIRLNSNSDTSTPASKSGRQGSLSRLRLDTAEIVLQAYFDQMTTLLLDRELQFTNDEATRQLARYRTLSALRGLDGVRKGLVVKFLHETRLIYTKDGKSPIIDLRDADLSGADLSHMELQYISLKRAYMQNTNLEGANLNMAKMNGARLQGASLRGTSLHKTEMIRTTMQNADLSSAELHSTNLVWADLSGADLREANMQWSIMLWANFTHTQFNNKTILPDQSNWTSGMELGRYTDNKHPEFWSTDSDAPLQRDIPTKDITTYTNDSIQ